MTHRSAEVKVTAIRSEDDLLEVPLAVTIVDPKLFATGRSVGLDEALSLVPGIVAQTRSGGTDVRIQIRGFGARGAGERSNAGTSRGVRFYQDGIPETEPDGRTSFDLLDLGHASGVEVIRSNASTLWGNASGGIVSISTVPRDNAPLLSLTTAAASFGFIKQSLLANAPLPGGQVYASVHVMSNDGWRSHAQADLMQANVGVLSTLGANTNVRVFAVGASNQYRIPGALTREQYVADPQQAQDDPAIYDPTYVERDERRSNRIGRLGTVFDHEFSSTHGISATAFIQTKFLQRSERNTFRDFTRYHLGGNALYRLKYLVSPTVVTKAIVGIDEQFQDGAVLFYSLDTVTKGRGTTLLANKREGADNLGVFAQNEWLIGDASITGGVRYDRITYHYEEYTGRMLSETRVFDAVTPKLGATWRLSTQLSLYANIGGGVEVPAGNETDPPTTTGEDTVYLVNPLLQPIRSTTLEFGTKGFVDNDEAFLRRINVDMAVFAIDVRNDVIPYRNGRFYQTAGRSSRYGIELGGSIVTSVNVSLFAAFTYMQSTYDDYVVDSGYIDPAKTGRTSSFNGNAIAGIPSVSATVRLRYDGLLIQGGFIETEFRHIGTYYADDANQLSVDAATVFDIGAGFRGTVTSFLDCGLTIRCTNVADTRYIGSAWINPDRTSGGTPYIEPGLPRSVNASVNVTFRP